MSAEEGSSRRKRKRAPKDQPREHQKKRSRKEEEKITDGSTGIPDESKTLVSHPVPGNGKDQHGKEVAHNGESKKVRSRRHQQREKFKKRHGGLGSPWTVSEPIGGWFLPQDAVFSMDEKYLILAHKQAIQIYSTATSLLVRTLPIPSGTIAAYALSESKSNSLYVATASGRILLWDWDTGSKPIHWELGTTICGIATTALEGSPHDVVYTHETGDYHIINAHNFRSGPEKSKTELKLVLESKTPIQSFQVMPGGSIIVVALQRSIMIGTTPKPTTATLQDFVYTWRECKLPQFITAFDACIRSGADPSAKSSTSQKSSSQPQGESLDLAIGGVDGAILVFEDILRKLIRIENPRKPQTEAEDLTPQRLHWHREAVGAVKWSLDGNYVISGGRETVLLMWQLKTGRRQELPHLTSAVDSLVVSPSGASYAVRLADNSVIVLSTTELKPKTNIAGIQSRRLMEEDSTLPRTKTIYSQLEKWTNPLSAIQKIPVAMNPLNPSQILLPVPSSQPRSEPSSTHLPAPYLQTFDLSTAHHVSRQALARNNATDFNTAPNRLRIREPDIKLLQLSHDGMWLATVEEWIPPRTDVQHLEENEEYTKEEQSLRREIYLKFWLWDKQREIWMLETRIDAPHGLPGECAPSRVFDLASDPNKVGFATVGEDGVVRIWQPKTRMRDGTMVRGSEKEGLISWSNRYSVELESKVETLDADFSPQSSALPINACLAYSTDGSVLAASQTWPENSSPGLVHIIDTDIGFVRRSMPNLYTTGLAALGFIGPFLVILSDSVTVWDLVDDELSYSIPFSLLNISASQKPSLLHLAINTIDSTFAIAFPVVELDGTALPGHEVSIKKAMSRLMVFKPQQPYPVWSTTFSNLVMSLLSARTGKGYIALDSASELRIISPKAGSSIPLIGPVAAAEKSLAGFKDEESEDGYEDMDEHKGQEDAGLQIDSPERAQQSVDFIEDTENDKPVVRPEQLAQIFDVSPSFALPPVKDLFSAVVGLYARKPRVREVATSA
ncbi:WD40 repeat-like protein [Lepidopterella palustris CBS 459.81]|uniref:WD40 repeat-like protein n=1 Tax=Lepidopterella palustris CBS 459.81 TaxID=1314670 RepID=A0A8E2JJ19_9PEZI|nr:WD40 repeat-like protein [Lepidopterella palustris CBS 459.81]